MIEKRIPRIRVLLYHRILSKASERDTANIGVNKDSFRKQIELLDRWGYTAITFSDFAHFLNGELDLPKKPVIITFDDTYKDMYDHGFPILLKYGMKAVVFVVADKSIISSVWDEGVGEVFELLGQHEILEMHSAGFEIGSHTLSHSRLTLVNLEIAREEIERSRMILETLLNAPVKSFAYPFGLVNDQVKELVKKSGYSFACASYTGPPSVAQDLFEIRRIKVHNTSNSLVFWFQLQQIYSYYRWLRWTVRHTLFEFLWKGKKSVHDEHIMHRKEEQKREARKQ